MNLVFQLVFDAGGVYWFGPDPDQRNQLDEGAGVVWGFVATASDSSSTKTTPNPVIIIGLVLVLLLLIVALSGFVVVKPNLSKAILLFGSYHGTIRKPGLAFTVPLSSKQTVSVKVRNFETGRIKVNDANGNPIEIGAVVVWQVRDTAEALFSVDDYPHF
ncbi:MAG: SPFH domain-containing protein, partial [Actinomycetes bacterium]